LFFWGSLRSSPYDLVSPFADTFSLAWWHLQCVLSVTSNYRPRGPPPLVTYCTFLIPPFPFRFSSPYPLIKQARAGSFAPVCNLSPLFVCFFVRSFFPLSVHQFSLGALNSSFRLTFGSPPPFPPSLFMMMEFSVSFLSAVSQTSIPRCSRFPYPELIHGRIFPPLSRFIRSCPTGFQVLLHRTPEPQPSFSVFARSTIDTPRLLRYQRIL